VPTGTFEINKYIFIYITQNFSQLGTPVITIFIRAARESARISGGVALVKKILASLIFKGT